MCRGDASHRATPSDLEKAEAEEQHLSEAERTCVIGSGAAQLQADSWEEVLAARTEAVQQAKAGVGGSTYDLRKAY